MMNATKTCMECGRANGASAFHCGYCGARLSELTDYVPREVSSTPHPRRTGNAALSSMPGKSYHSGSRYTALREIAGLVNAAAMLVVVIVLIGAFWGFVKLADSFSLGLGIIGSSVIVGGLIYVVLKVIAESISVVLDLEANTRRANELLEVIAKNSAPEPVKSESA